MYRHVPNLITVARLILTVIFFALLHWHASQDFYRTMWIALGVYLLAVGTDWLDGYLARSWGVESAFGRVVDPFVDKILVCGAFVFFSSTNFLDADILASYGHEASVTGVAPWMTVLLIGREFLITGLRGLIEARGGDFRADWAGKIKMGTQCFAVGTIILDVATAQQGQHILSILYVRNISIWLTLVVTTLSAISYIRRACQIYQPGGQL